MPNPLGPFSPFLGSLNQDINPWTWLIRTLNQPFGLINVTNYQTSDPATEQRIVGEVAGYGRQLGRLMDAVTVLLDRLDTAALSPADREALRGCLPRIAHNHRGCAFPGPAKPSRPDRTTGHRRGAG